MSGNEVGGTATTELDEALESLPHTVHETAKEREGSRCMMNRSMMYRVVSYRCSMVRGCCRCMMHSMSSRSMSTMCSMGCMVAVCCMVAMGTMVSSMVGSVMASSVTSNNADEKSSNYKLYHVRGVRLCN